MRDQAILWDFDGTLGHRVGGAWSACAIEVLDAHEPGHGRTLDAIRPFFQTGFPWHSPSVPHPELCEADAWWAYVTRVIARTYERVGVPSRRARELAALYRARYVDVGRWTLFDDAHAALTRARSLGYRNVIVSNHVPELPQIIETLRLTELVHAAVNSAATGYEKPRPEAFRLACLAAGDVTRYWMVGDNYDADVAGAEACGIPAILVRTSDQRAQRTALGVAEAVESIIAEG